MSTPSAPKRFELDKRSKIMLVVLAVIVVAAAAFFLLKGNGSSDDSTADAPVTVPTAGASASLRPSSGGTASKSATPSPAQPSFPAPDNSRDPFAPLPGQVAASASAAASATPSAEPSSSQPSPAPSSAISSPGSTPSPSPSVSPDVRTSTSSINGAALSGSHTMTLLSVTGTNATMTVDGQDTDAKAGDSVASGLVVVKITDDAVFITFDSKAYAVAIGQTVSV